jgi:thiol:disulfide interchange protein DsbA
VESAPTLVIDGRYVTSPSIAGRPGQPEQQAIVATLQVADALVAKAAKK